MAVQIDATEARLLPGGVTAREAIEGVVSVRLRGLGDLVKKLNEAAVRAEKDPDRILLRAVIRGSKPIADAYRSKVQVVTGNLKNSIRTRPGRNKYDGVSIAVTGPVHRAEADEWDVNNKRGAGNHAWLIEFGTGRRKPGSQKRRAYVRVHQAINGRMATMSRLQNTFNNEQFEQMGRGYYFLMGSRDNKNKKGTGFFVPDGRGGTRPYFLESGDTYGAMRAQHPMEKSINESRQQVLSAVSASIKQFIDDLSR